MILTEKAMTKSIAIAAAALVLGVGMVAYLLVRHGPKKDLELTAAALDRVKSWHEESEGPGSQRGSWVHTTSDMVCPQGEHAIVDESDAGSVVTHREVFNTMKYVYYRSPDRWVRYGDSSNECASGPHLDGVGINLKLAEALSGASVQAGITRNVGSEACRDYRVHGVWRDFIMCVNQSDHLPREIVSSLFKDENGEFVKPLRATYSKWNRVSVSDFPANVPSD